jgi:DNA-binding transcriptional LysR family regulator
VAGCGEDGGIVCLFARSTIYAYIPCIDDRGDTSTPMAWTHAVNRWRVNDLDLRHRMILDGLVWGTMPGHHVADDLRQGRLVMLPLDPSDPANQMLPELTYSAAHPVPKPLGLAGRWLVSRLVTEGSADSERG